MKPFAPLHRFLLGLPLACGLAVTVACQGPAAPPSTTPPSAAAETPVALPSAAPVPTSPQARPPEPLITGPYKGKTLWAMYIIGSDLEDDLNPRNKVSDELEAGRPVTTGSASRDLQELVSGYKALSPEERKNVELFVGFGGARKASWKGIRYLDGPCLLEDAENQIFGDGACLAGGDPSADLGDERTFAAFLEQVKQRAKGKQKVAVTLWNHGGAFRGIGPDTNTKRLLTLQAMRKAFDRVGLHVDVLGFDACLMATVEVAQALQPAATFLVASEELEPGHGWDYERVVDYMGKNPGASPFQIGQRVVDDYIDSPRHQRTHGRTLSVIDLRKLKPVVQAVESLGGALGSDLRGTYPAVLASVGDAQHFGRQRQADVEVTIDLRHWGENLKKAYPGVSGPSEQLIRALDDCVVYRRHDDTKPNANGLSIFSLKNLASYERRSYNDKVAPSGWFSFVSRFMERGLHDLAAPTIQAVDGCAQGIGGDCLKVEDNTGVKSVLAVHAAETVGAGGYRIRQEDGRYLILAREEQHIDGDEVFLQTWNGEAIMLAANAGDGAPQMAFPAYFDQATDGIVTYMSLATWNGQGVFFYLWWDKQNRQAVDHWMFPYSVTENGEVVFDKEQAQLQAGDTIQFLYEVYAPGNAEQQWVPGPNLTFTGTPAWRVGSIGGDAVYFAEAQDLNGNVAYTVPQSVDPDYEYQEVIPGDINDMPAVEAGNQLVPVEAQGELPPEEAIINEAPAASEEPPAEEPVADPVVSEEPASDAPADENLVNNGAIN